MQRETTINYYKTVLKKYGSLTLKEPYIVLNELNLMKNGKGDPLSLSYKKTIICAILWKLNKNKSNKKQIEQYKIFLKDIREQLKKDERNHNITHGIIPKWEDIIAIRDNNANDDLEHLILSLYTYIPPRRLMDYVLLVFSKDKPNETEYNYYVESDKQIIFNKYKTSRTFGKYVIDVPEELNNIIMNYINKYNIKNGNKILNVRDYHGIHYRLKKLLGCSIDNIRHSYVNEFYKLKTPSSDEIHKTASDMGHTVETNLNYRKK